MANLASLLHHPSSTMGGMQDVAREINSHLVSRGHTVDEISFELTAWQRSPLGWAMGGELFQFGRTSYALASKSRSYDAILNHDASAYSLIAGLTIFHTNLLEYTRKRYAPYHPNYWRLRLVGSTLQRLSAQRRGLNIAVSKSQADWLSKSGIRVDRVIYHGIEAAALQCDLSQAKARQQLGLREEGIVALNVGRADFSKNWDRFVSLAASLPEIQFLAVGPAPKYFRTAPNNCICTGVVPREQLPVLYRAATFFVQCSYSESFGLAFAQALMCGLPFLATSTGLAKDIFTEFPECRSAMLEDDLHSDAQKLRRLVSSSAMQSELENFGKIFAEKHLQKETWLSSYRAALQHVIGAKI